MRASTDGGRRGPGNRARATATTVGSLLLLAAALAACTHSGSSSGETVVFADPPIPARARRTGAAPPELALNLVLGLARDDEGLALRVRDIATPGSPHYHERHTVEDVAAEFGATDETIAAIAGDLGRRGFTVKQDVTRGFVATRMTVAELEALFATSFGTYAIDGTGTFVAPDDAPSAPAAWRGAVREVMGLSTLPALDAARTTAGAARTERPGSVAPARAAFTVIDQPGARGASGTPQGCADALAETGYKPNELLTAYGVDALRAQGYLGQGMRMALVEDGGFVQSDIDAFTACYAIENPTTPAYVLTGGLTEPLPVGSEATLDIEVALAVAPQLAGLYVFESSNTSTADTVLLYAATLDRANTGGETIEVLSSSLGTCELSLTQGVVDVMEYVLAVAAAANVSVFASAGDSGSSTCYHHDQTTETESASYPATSAYATAVGGTNLLLDTANALSGSSVWNDQPWNGEDSAGGGGPSTFVAAPAWQQSTGTGDAMRTTPDVAFFGDPLPGYTIYRASNGGWYDDGGTSAATPFLAASTALLHQAMLAEKGTSPVVAYEWIYGIAASSESAVIYDIVLGDNDLFAVGCCTAGPGYDQASGWGSLDVGAVSQVLNGSPRYQVAN